MPGKEITTVILVENLSHYQEIWRNTLLNIKDKKITNVIHAEDHFLDQDIWNNTLRQFMKIKEILSVLLVESPLQIQ